ncbi:ABC transporter [Microbacterium sp. 179-I 3D4 NHS]|uniref:ABC transporter n=1 Tax=Microbacterium sp. 179-I 3D4 NHS TaxID=3142381 RepID=UPI0039A1887F
MSDPEVPRHDQQPNDVDHVVDSANAGLDAAAAARADVPGATPTASDRDVRSSEQAAGDDVAVATPSTTVDPDLAAFEAAERDYPGTFSTTSGTDAEAARAAADRVAADAAADRADAAADAADRAAADAEATAAYSAPVARDDERSVADTAYASRADDAETTIVPSEPGVAAAPAQPQPIFVQAPEPPRDRGNRGTAGAIGLLATLAFALLYLGATIGLRAIAGEVTAQNVGETALAPLMTWGFWTPVVVFFLGFWFLGAIINRGRWGLWVVFGIIVGVIAYAGHILGQLFEAPFWKVSASAGLELVGEQMLAPLAIAAFVFARELTIWFGAWVARSGARKTELNAEAQREYERTLEAGPTLAR